MVSDFGEISNNTDPLVNPTNQPWIAISAGSFHSLGIRDNGVTNSPGGTLWAWGTNGSGELGTDDTLTPGQGKLFTWGKNTSGELGLGTTGTAQWKESPVGSSDEWIYVVGGDAHFLALKKNGSLYSCEGGDYSYQTGRGDPAVVGATLSTPGLVQ